MSTQDLLTVVIALLGRVKRSPRHLGHYPVCAAGRVVLPVFANPKDDGERSVIARNILDRDVAVDRPNQT